MIDLKKVTVRWKLDHYVPKKIYGFSRLVSNFRRSLPIDRLRRSYRKSVSKFFCQ